MAIVRLMLILVIIATFVLLAAYIATRNKQYLTYLKQMLKYAGWTFAALFVLYLMSRVIRF
jgi:threonine/homoserine/homoserine lactone efflux protein